MSVTVFFPSLPGIAFPVKRSPLWKTLKHDAVSGKATTLPLWSFPRYKFEVTFNVLRSSAAASYEWQQLQAFVNLVQGSAYPFHYTDPNDYQVTGQRLGTGDGATTDFAFVRALPGGVSFVEPVQDADAATLIVYVDGVAKVANSDYSVLSTSPLGTSYAIRFASAPSAGAVITADFQYYWLCRLDDDQIDFENFMSGFFDLKKLAFTTIKQ